MPLEAGVSNRDPRRRNLKIEIASQGGSCDLRLDNQNFAHILYPGDKESTNGGATIVRISSPERVYEAYLQREGDERQYDLLFKQSTSPDGKVVEVDDSYHVWIKRT